MVETKPFERSTQKHLRLHVLPTERFKTFAISVYVGLPLNEEDVTASALIPFVLRRGTETLPETVQFRERLDDLYGAGFGIDIYKRGDYQIIQFRMDTIEDQFVQDASGLLQQSLQLMGEVLTRPLIEEGGFRRKYVDAEKNTLQKRIESMINDKIKYAAERCIEEMCKEEPYRLHPLGMIDKLQGIDAVSLYEHYRKWLDSAMIDIYVVGRTTLAEVQQHVEQYFNLSRPISPAYQPSIAHRQVEQVKQVTESLEVTQGKLNLGLRIPVTYGDKLYPVALMYNGILGGYPHSKLFINVREKASLAYYAASRLDGHKGILTIQSGIEIANKEQALAIIEQQLESLQQAQISELELQQTKAMIRHQLLETADSAYALLAYDFNQVISGRQRSIAELIAEIDAVEPEQIASLARQVQLDTIYFLRDKKGE